jgi:DNA-binding transcriptional regulator YdaS (Cro superfamily)
LWRGENVENFFSGFCSCRSACCAAAGGLCVEKKLQKVLAVSELAVPLQPQTGKRPTAPRAPAGARAGPGEKTEEKFAQVKYSVYLCNAFASHSKNDVSDFFDTSFDWGDL